MPIRELYTPKNPFGTPEPHAKPGYTGYLPGFGLRRAMQMGKVYDRMTHDIMVAHPVAGLRCGMILSTDEELQQKLEEEVLAWKHEKSTQNVKYRRNMVVGYTGYVPRRRYLCGKSYSDECTMATALMEKLKIING